MFLMHSKPQKTPQKKSLCRFFMFFLWVFNGFFVATSAGKREQKTTSIAGAAGDSEGSLQILGISVSP